MTYCNAVIEHHALPKGGFFVERGLDVHYAAGGFGIAPMMEADKCCTASRTFCRHRLQDSSRRGGGSGTGAIT